MARYRTDKNVRLSIRFTAEERNLIAEKLPKRGADAEGLRTFTRMAVAYLLEEFGLEDSPS